MAERGTAGRPSSTLRRVLVPLALAQFICSFAGSNLNVTINDIGADLNTTVKGVQTAITIFLLVMAALVIAVIILLSRRIEDPLPAGPTRPFEPVERSCRPSASRSSSWASWRPTTTAG